MIILESLNFSRTIELLKNTHLSFFLLAISVLLFQIMFSTIRWKFVLDNFNYQLPIKLILSYLWIGLFFNQALPSSIGGDAMRGYYLNRKHEGIKNATLGVLLDRLFGLIGLVLLVLILVPLLFMRFPEINLQWELILVMVGMISAFIFVIFFDFFRLGFLNSRIIRGFQSLAFESRRMLFSKSPGLILISISFLIHLLSILAVMYLSKSLGLEIELAGILLIIPIVTLFTLIPISVAGWGVREGLMVVGLGLLDVPPEQALALSILYGLSMLMIALPGGIVWLSVGKSFNKT